MKNKNLIALLTVFENFFITVEQKVLFEKKTFIEYTWKVFSTANKSKHHCVLDKHQKTKTQLIARKKFRSENELM